MQQLAEWLAGIVEDAVAEGDDGERLTGVRAVAQLTGVGTGTISRIANNELKGRPKLATLVKLANGLNRPLADLVEMSGAGLGLPSDDDALLARLQAEASLDPLLGEILDLLRSAPSEDRRAVLRYLRGALASRR
jgi:transcriptional regulator with XRE-family HTH domain